MGEDFLIPWVAKFTNPFLCLCLYQVNRFSFKVNSSNSNSSNKYLSSMVNMSWWETNLCGAETKTNQYPKFQQCKDRCIKMFNPKITLDFLECKMDKPHKYLLNLTSLLWLFNISTKSKDSITLRNSRTAWNLRRENW